MTTALARKILDCARDAAQLYHRLVIVVGPRRSGKTAALRVLQRDHGLPLVNVNLALSERLLNLRLRQRPLRTASLVEKIVQENDGELVLLDNLEILFEPVLQQDPLRLLQNVSRRRTIVATWRAAASGPWLTYAVPDHPEYRCYADPQALIVATSGILRDTSGPTEPQEQS